MKVVFGLLQPRQYSGTARAYLRVGKRTWERLELQDECRVRPEISRGGPRMTTMIADPPRKTAMGVGFEANRSRSANTQAWKNAIGTKRIPARLALLPEPKSRWDRIGLSAGVQLGIFAFLLIIPLLFPNQMKTALNFRVVELMQPVTEIPVARPRSGQCGPSGIWVRGARRGVPECAWCRWHSSTLGYLRNGCGLPRNRRPSPSYGVDLRSWLSSAGRLVKFPAAHGIRLGAPSVPKSASLLVNTP